MPAVIESPAPPGRHRDTDADAAFLDRLHALEVTAVRLATERDAAVAQARRDASEAASMRYVNLQLQLHLDEYNADRRAYESTIADLRAQVALLLEQAAAAEALRATPAPRRRGRRH